LVGQPSGDGGTSCSLWVLGVVKDILLDHSPVLVSELESCMDVLKHQESGFGVLHGESLHVGSMGLLAQVCNIFSVVVRSIFSQVKKILSQRVPWVLKSKGIVTGWNDAVLGSCFSSESHRGVVYSLVQDSIWEDIIVSLDTHNESSQIEVFGWGRLLPHL